MSNLTLKQLRYFAALARHGHFGHAAEACAISQPALSMQIKELEEALGTMLFERGARQVRLTGFGEVFAERVREILRDVDELGDLARASRDRLVGRLRIGIIPTIAPYLLPRIIGDLTRAFPELDIQVRETLTPKLAQELSDGLLDTAIVALPVSDPAFAEVPILTENFVLVRHARQAGQPAPSREKLRGMRAFASGGGPLLSRSGAFVLQHTDGQAARGAGREFIVHAGADGRGRDRRDLHPGDGGRGRDPARPAYRSRGSTIRNLAAPSA